MRERGRERETEGMYAIIVDYYYKELVHMIMEAAMSQNLKPASWRSGRASGVVLVQIQRPENQDR